MKAVINFNLIFALLIYSQMSIADIGICSQMLIETPGSVEAIICFERETSILDERMQQAVAAIETQIKKGEASFRLEDFRSSQSKWKQHVESTCWLDAAGAGNATAVIQHCVSRYKLQRLSQLQMLHKGLTGEEPAMWPMSNLEPRR